MSEIKDLDLLFDDKKEAFRFTGDKDGQKYSFRMFVPTAVSLEHLKLEKDKVSDAEKQSLILEAFFREQYPNMNREWIDENISLVKQNYIFSLILKELNRVNDFLLQEAESSATQAKRAKKVREEIEQ